MLDPKASLRVKKVETMVFYSDFSTRTGDGLLCRAICCLKTLSTENFSIVNLLLPTESALGKCNSIYPPELQLPVLIQLVKQ